MELRGIAEIELRWMLGRATRYRPHVIAGRWVIETRYRGTAWDIVVEPDTSERVLAVITVYEAT